MKTENKHTPGPWKIEIEDHVAGTEFYIIGKDKQSVCQIKSYALAAEYLGQNGSELEIRAEANSNLIAAAPDMLEALKDLVADFECEHEKPGNYMGYVNAKAAISKAEGNQIEVTQK